MTHKEHIQNNNAELRECILLFENIPSVGEDVTAETNEYTAKLKTLESAISALETELEGKASADVSVDTCVVTVKCYLHPIHDDYTGGAEQLIAYTNKQLSGVFAYLPFATIDDDTWDIIAPSVTSYTVVKGTIFFYASIMDIDESSLGDCTITYNPHDGDHSIMVNSDCTLVIKSWGEI